MACQSHMKEWMKQAVKKLVIKRSKRYEKYECQNQPDCNGSGEYIKQDDVLIKLLLYLYYNVYYNCRVPRYTLVY